MTATRGDKDICMNCGGSIEFNSFRGAGHWEPDIDEGSERVIWRHSDGYASCTGERVFAVPGGGSPEDFLVQLRRVNVERCKEWHDDFGYLEGEWSGADWSNAMMGEAGEAANVVKKLRRLATGHPARRDPGFNDLRSMLAEEIADTVIYADLLAHYYGIDMRAAIALKFNEVSEREGLPQRVVIDAASREVCT